MHLARQTTTVAVTSAAILALTSIGAVAQDEPQPTTVAEVNSGGVSGTVTIDGIALEPKSAGDDEYFFSDGTGITIIDVDTTNAEGDVPLLDPINIVGQVASDEIDVSSWTKLEAPNENMGPREEAFMVWAALLGDGDTAGMDEATASPEGVEWTLTIIGGAESIAVPLEVGATLLLEDGQASGSTGCNSFSGTYTLEGEFISFDENFAVTQALCEGPAGEIEQAYLEALPTVVGWGIDNTGELSLVDGAQSVVLVYE